MSETTPSLEPIVAERTVLFITANQPPVKVQIKIGLPKPSPHGEDEWVCPVQIVGLGNGEILSAFGVDSLQALLLAFDLVRAELDVINRKHNGQLTWLGDSDLGI